MDALNVSLLAARVLDGEELSDDVCEQLLLDPQVDLLPLQSKLGEPGSRPHLEQCGKREVPRRLFVLHPGQEQ